MDFKATLHAIINFVGNGAIFTFIPDPIKIYAILVFNIVQALYAYFDPTYTLKKIGMSKGEYLGKTK